MARANRKFVPIGTPESSPAIYRWARRTPRKQSPVGTADRKLGTASIIGKAGQHDMELDPNTSWNRTSRRGAHFSRPYGTSLGAGEPSPSDESLGYCRMSLRDKCVDIADRLWEATPVGDGRSYAEGVTHHSPGSATQSRHPGSPDTIQQTLKGFYTWKAMTSRTL